MMNTYGLFLIIALAITFCFATLSNGLLSSDDELKNLLKREQDSHYKYPGGLYSTQNYDTKKKTYTK